MANELWRPEGGEGTTYCVLKKAGQCVKIADGSLETENDANRALYAIPVAVGTGAKSDRRGSVPAGTPEGIYAVLHYVQAGVGPVAAADGYPDVIDVLDWTGTAVRVSAVQTGDSFARIGATGSGLTSLAQAASYTSTRAGYLDNLSAGAAATAANQTTILARLGAWTGTGVNTVLGAFKALLSKTATLPTDIGGTFTPTTDSTEALAEGLANVQTEGVGANACTLTCNDTTGAPVADADVWVTSSVGGTVVAGTKQTNSSGQVTFYLDAGSTYYRYAQKDNVNFTNPTAFVASAD